MKEDHSILEVQMFGHFSIVGLGGMLNEDNLRSEMLTRLLVYILCHRQQELTVQELADALWNEDESDNPAGALKNLMYRLRGLMKKIWGTADFIQTGRGAYIWNKEIPVRVDVEIFEEKIKQASREEDLCQRISLYQEATQLYKGAFLPKISGEYWVASQATYYHSAYLNSVKIMTGLLEEQGRYDEMAEYSSAALQIDALDEELHCCFIRALMGQNKPGPAMQQYKKAEKTLYDHLGITPSEELRELYEQLLEETHKQELDITAIQRELMEDEIGGAFQCEFGAFKRIYHLEVRRAERMGISVFLLMITVAVDESLKEGTDAYLETISGCMDRIEKTLLGCLRSGDVISKYSGSQYLVLLPACQYENAKLVAERLEKAFWKNYKERRVRLQFDYAEVGS